MGGGGSDAATLANHAQLTYEGAAIARLPWDCEAVGFLEWARCRCSAIAFFVGCLAINSDSARRGIFLEYIGG